MIRICENVADIEGVKHLFNACFPDDEFNTWYFENVFKAEKTLVFIDDDKVTSMLQMHDVQVVCNDKTYASTYIYGAATHEDYRRRHQMAHLIAKSFELDKKSGKLFSVLIPQENWLFDFYKKFGYEKKFYMHTGTFSAQTEAYKTLPFVRATFEDIFEINRIYEQNISSGCYVKRDNEYWKSQLKLSAETGYGFNILKDINNKTCAYASAYSSDGQLFVHEIFAESKSHFYSLLQSLCVHFGESTAKYMTLADKNENNEFACVKFHGEPQQNFYGYMNLMYN